VYTSVWEVYREMVLFSLQDRYAETVTDIRRQSVNDYHALVQSHRHLVQQRSLETNTNFDDLLAFLDSLAEN
jgi:two-component sensor histidine kinase